MNEEQKDYIHGKILNEYGDVLFDSIAGLSIYSAIALPGIIPAIGFNVLSLPFLAIGGILTLARFVRYKHILSIKTETPFAHSSEIIFEDKKGLEMLLEITGREMASEWGTVYKANMDKGRAVIYEILHPDNAKKEGIIRSAEAHQLKIDFQKIDETYNGIHHFHPTEGCQNFAVNLIDRTKPAEWINLLSFNMPYGPEIIGFNLKYTYIPQEKSNNLRAKSKLVRATTRDIWRYLRQS